MLIFRDYDKDKRIDRIWYKSSNIIYSECYDKENDYKELKVVFKKGMTYIYHKIDVNDYVMFVHGGLDGSNGKALNKFVKEKNYEYEKVEPTSLEELQTLLESLQEKKEKEKEQTKEEVEYL